MWDECDQLCTNLNNSYTCSCMTNYTLEANGHCKHVQSNTAKVMFSVGSKIYETNTNGDNVRTLYDNIDMDISSFDYNSKTNLFYFADDKNNRVNLIFIFKIGKLFKLKFAYNRARDLN